MPGWSFVEYGDLNAFVDVFVMSNFEDMLGSVSRWTVMALFFAPDLPIDISPKLMWVSF